MGKGGANPYPLWWATSDEPVTEQPRNKSRKRYSTDDIYKSQQDKEREYYDAFYREKSWRERDRERKEQFKRDFMSGKYFSYPEPDNEESKPYFHEPCDDIDPIFKIKKSSSFEDYKKEYRKLILKNHPDKGGDSKMFIMIQDAWKKIQLYFAS
jgi:hypothetical protein